MLSMPKISKCDMTMCAYNMDSKCHTLAVTIGDGACAACDTFTNMAKKGGDAETIAGVGACRRESCRHNTGLECTAGSISVSAHLGHADCGTFMAR